MTHSCPGLCGRTVTATTGIFTCPGCSRLLPADLRVAISVSWWQKDWPVHSRAMSDGLLWLANNIHARPGRPRTGHSGHTPDEAS